MKELYHHKPERFQRRDLMRVFSLKIIHSLFHISKKIQKCSGHINNQTSMVRTSAQRGKREESQSGAEEAKRKTFPMIWADFNFARFHFQRWRIREKKGLSIVWPWRLNICDLRRIVNLDCSGHEIDETNIGNFNYSSGEHCPTYPLETLVGDSSLPIFKQQRQVSVSCRLVKEKLTEASWTALSIGMSTLPSSNLLFSQDNCWWEIK